MIIIQKDYKKRIKSKIKLIYVKENIMQKTNLC